jgi:acetate kinase
VLDASDALLRSEDLPALDPAAERAPDALRAAIDRAGPIDAVGHRVVHGGVEFDGPVRADAGVLARIDALSELAPLHQPASVAGLRWLARALPDLPQVACFDTAFHATLPASAATYALPRAWRERWGLRRFGFHGLSHAYAARRAAELLRRPIDGLRIVTCHLGAGASLAAVRGGRSVDTTMGFTPLEGLVMATRSGNVDPGLLLWLQETAGLTARELSHGLEHEAGLTGLAGTGDMRAVLQAASEGSDDARLALDVYVHRLRAGIAAMAASLGGLDVLVFTGGVGERAPAVRAAALDSLGFMGLAIDPGRNETGSGDREISPAGASSPRVLVVASREDLEIARQVRSILG